VATLDSNLTDSAAVAEDVPDGIDDKAFLDSILVDSAVVAKDVPDRFVEDSADAMLSDSVDSDDSVDSEDLATEDGESFLDCILVDSAVAAKDLPDRFFEDLADARLSDSVDSGDSEDSVDSEDLATEDGEAFFIVFW
jgi:hypothetical protein